jgi:hypothetical protein
MHIRSEGNTEGLSYNARWIGNPMRTTFENSYGAFRGFFTFHSIGGWKGPLWHTELVSGLQRL